MKKGASQIDWIISLAIFLLYLAWFFIFVTPTFTSTEMLESSVEKLERNFKKETTWKIESTPLFLETPKTLENEVVVIEPFQLPWNIQNTVLNKETNFVTTNDKLFFFSDINLTDDSFTNIFWFKHGNLESETEESGEGINALETSIETADINVSIDDYMLEEMVYREIKPIIQSDYFINDQVFTDLTPTTNLVDKTILAGYIVDFGDYKHETFFFQGHNKIYNYLYSEVESTFKISFKLYPYKEIVFDNFNVVELNYSTEEADCYNQNSIYLDFKRETDGLYFYFDKPVEIKICNSDSELELNITTTIDRRLNYRIIPHPIETNLESLNPELITYFGTKDKSEGLSIAKLNELNEKTYEQLKDEWDINEDFRIIIFNSTLADLYKGDAEPLYLFGNEILGDRNVKAIEFDTRILNKDLTPQLVSVNLAIW